MAGSWNQNYFALSICWQLVFVLFCFCNIFRVGHLFHSNKIKGNFLRICYTSLQNIEEEKNIDLYSAITTSHLLNCILEFTKLSLVLQNPIIVEH